MSDSREAVASPLLNRGHLAAPEPVVGDTQRSQCRVIRNGVGRRARDARERGKSEARQRLHLCLRGLAVP